MLCPRLLKSLPAAWKYHYTNSLTVPRRVLRISMYFNKARLEKQKLCRQTVRGLENAASNRPSKLFDLQQEVASFRPCRLTGPFSLADRQVPLGSVQTRTMYSLGWLRSNALLFIRSTFRGRWEPCQKVQCAIPWLHEFVVFTTHVISCPDLLFTVAL